MQRGIIVSIRCIYFSTIVYEKIYKIAIRIVNYSMVEWGRTIPVTAIYVCAIID